MNRTKSAAVLAAGCAIVATLTACSHTAEDPHAHCAMEFNDASPGHPLCTDSPDYRPTAKNPADLASPPSPEEARFLQAIHTRGLPTWNLDWSRDDGKAIRNAHAICDDLDRQVKGGTLLDTAKLIEAHDVVAPKIKMWPMTDHDAQVGVGVFVDISAKYFCPPIRRSEQRLLTGPRVTTVTEPLTPFTPFTEVAGWSIDTSADQRYSANAGRQSSRYTSGRPMCTRALAAL